MADAPQNERMVLIIENENPQAQPLIIVVPKWSKQHIEKLPKLEQQQVVDEFSSKITDAWEEFMRYGYED